MTLQSSNLRTSASAFMPIGARGLEESVTDVSAVHALSAAATYVHASGRMLHVSAWISVSAGIPVSAMAEKMISAPLRLTCKVTLSKHI